MKELFRGSITALVTPFTAGVVDVEGFRRLVEWQISEGSRELVRCGTTGDEWEDWSCDWRALAFDSNSEPAELGAGRFGACRCCECRVVPIAEALGA